MNETLQQLSDQQKATWNKFSAGWKKWDDMTMDFLRPTGDEMIRLLAPKSGDVILDVAAGTGEPGLSIASLIDDGTVIITDLADGMLEVAREKAKSRGMLNVETVACDVSALPFGDNTFDAVSCRFGLMFFPDMLLASQEMLRVLKPGGRAAIAIWNAPEQNFWLTAAMSTIAKHMELPATPAEAPGIFRCAKDGFTRSLLEEAGFTNVSEHPVLGQLDCGTTEVYWNFVTEVVAPAVAALSNADDEMRASIKTEVFRLVNQKFPQGNVAIDANSTVVFATKETRV